MEAKTVKRWSTFQSTLKLRKGGYKARKVRSKDNLCEYISRHWPEWRYIPYTMEQVLALKSGAMMQRVRSRDETRTRIWSIASSGVGFSGSLLPCAPANGSIAMEAMEVDLLGRWAKENIRSQIWNIDCCIVPCTTNQKALHQRCTRETAPDLSQQLCCKPENWQTCWSIQKAQKRTHRVRHGSYRFKAAGHPNIGK
ncbi:hypothetical protein B0H10DRAFT_1952874 [Mycena sp. CBHHK59/15]|nr:hypothetical protein B0H10DRAFT_1952874 [Mycena sp. CBHHK59/15]